MIRERHSWPDADGMPVAIGDWIEVFSVWGHYPKFEGRAVQVVEVLSGALGSVFHLRDPVLDLPYLYMLADGHGYRRVFEPAEC